MPERNIVRVSVGEERGGRDGRGSGGEMAVIIGWGVWNGMGGGGRKCVFH